MVEITEETSRTKSLMLKLPDWPGGYRSGQHVDVRLTAEDGYVAERSYSIGSAPEDEHLVLTVERLDDGEVSPYLVDVLQPGDDLELRGPIGGYFVWEESLGGPLILIAGGSGVVPLRSMLRHWAATSRALPVRLLYSSRRLSEVIYRDELLGYSKVDQVDVDFALTRDGPTIGRDIAAGSTRPCSPRSPGRRPACRGCTYAARTASWKRPLRR